MARIEIYTTPYCPFCVRAKALLNSKKVAFEEIDVSDDDDLREQMVKRAGGRRTVPEIFVNGRIIGGFDELRALDLKGELDPLLAEPS
ncbi:MAG TPA: glutaredoxin 3 [Candidatus Binataceae bacterium]|nr:glutaredoxin 3 [Candidatus Binataceae bacterium]